MTPHPDTTLSVGDGGKERPIIFSAPMVRAILAGRKTQTRRVFVPPAPYDIGDDITVELATGSMKPKWQAGDRLWVREAWRTTYGLDWRDESRGRPPRPSEFDPATTPIEYLADETCELNGATRSPIFMPRWASRLTLEVTAVRVERLQDISEADARAEGAMLNVPCKSAVGGTTVASDSWYFDIDLDGRLYEGRTARDAYEILWGKLHGWKSWDTNPWVAAITFRVLPPSDTPTAEGERA